MKISEFNEKVKVGDTIIIFKFHASDVPLDGYRYTFQGFTGNCKMCPGCPGYVKLRRFDGVERCDCYRSNYQNNIRLKIIHDLPEELFEI